MCAQCRTGDFPQPRDHIDHSGGHARFLRQAAEKQRGKRRILRRLDDHRITGRQGRSDAPSQQKKGKIPWKDKAAHTVGCSHRVRLESRYRVRPGTLRVNR